MIHWVFCHKDVKKAGSGQTKHTHTHECFQLDAPRGAVECVENKRDDKILIKISGIPLVFDNFL